MKVIFVGIHNKPGKEPLDSSTLSGKTIDAVIERLDGYSCVKSNLFDTDYIPKKEEGIGLLNKFTDRVKPEPQDLLVLLGNDVQKFLKNVYSCRTLSALHPSLRFAKISRKDYIEELVGTIKSYTETYGFNH